jgi:hypothetical protein
MMRGIPVALGATDRATTAVVIGWFVTVVVDVLSAVGHGVVVTEQPVTVVLVLGVVNKGVGVALVPGIALLL